MALMKIDCDYCGGSWEVYERNYTDQVSKYCPHCGKGIPDEMWTGVAKAFERFKETNTDLFSESIGKHLPLFQVNFVSDILFKAYKEGRSERNGNEED